MRIRPSKIKNLMDQAKIVAERSHDEETQVGAILISNSNGAQIATGYNGFVRGADDTKLPSTRPDKYEVMVHAEQNLLLNCAKLGISVNNTTLICTLTPCTHCARMLYQAGVTKIICGQKYKDFEKVMSMQDIKVRESITNDGFVELIYEQVLL